MNADELAALQIRFRASDLSSRQAILDALVEVFRAADYRYISAKLFPDHFVGDIVALLPPELCDVIFSYLEPQDIYRLRNVSSLWNQHLSRPEFLHAMDLAMYQRGQYLLDSDFESTKTRSFEEKVRNRSRLLNGRAKSFSLIRHKTSVVSELAYSHGILVNYFGSQIYVKNLRDDAGWEALVGDDLESFELVQVTPQFIIAVTRLGFVYVWSATTLDRCAKFRMPVLPFEVEASLDTLVLFCPDAWYLFAMPTQTLSRCTKPQEGSEYVTGHVESTGHIYTVTVDGSLTTYRLNETRDNIVLQSLQNVYDVMHETTTTAADAAATVSMNEYKPPSNIVVVWNHGSLYSSPLTISGAQTQVFVLRGGTLRYCHTIENDTLQPSELVFFPELETAYDLICQHDRGMPLGMYQVHHDRWRPVTTDIVQDAEPMYHTNAANWTVLVGGAQAASNPNQPAGAGAGAEWAMRYEDAQCLWTGDSEFLVCSHIQKGFTRVWKFF